MFEIVERDFTGPSGVRANFLVRADTADECTCQATYRDDEYHFASLSPAPGDFMIDAGGYIGTTAILYAQLYPAARIVCIEPLPDNVALIRKNIDRNGLTDRIFLEAKALCDVNGEKVEIFYRDDSPVGIAHKFVGSSSQVYTESVSAKFFPAETITLDKIVEKYLIGKVRLMKMDMECSEYKALEKVSIHTLEKIQTIVGEYHNPDKATITNPRTTLYNLVKNMFDDKSVGEETQFIGSFLFERKT